MGDFNRVISFVLGLIVVVVFIAVVTGRLNIRQRILTSNDRKVVLTATPTPTPKSTEKKGFFSFLGKATPTPTLTPTIKPTRIVRISPTIYKNTQVMYIQPSKVPTPTLTYMVYQKNQSIESIPETGAPTILLPLEFGTLAVGFLLKKIKK